MDVEGGPTRRVDVLDLREGLWKQAADLIGEKPIDGFGVAACEAGGNVYVSSLAGTVQRLTADGSAWEVAASLDAPRFFHQMTPCEGGLFVVGGSNMVDGKISEPAVVPVGAGGE